MGAWHSSSRPSRAPQKSETDLYEERVARARMRADEEVRRADMAVERLVTQRMRHDTELARYQMRYCWRSTLEFLLRSVFGG